MAAGSWNTGNTSTSLPASCCSPVKFMVMGLVLNSFHSLQHLELHKRIPAWGRGKQLWLLTSLQAKGRALRIRCRVALESSARST